MPAPSFTDIIDFFKDAGAVVEGSGKIVTALGALYDATSNLTDINNSYLVGMGKQNEINDTIIDQYQKFAQKSLFLEKRNEQINKSFGVGVKQAAALSQQFQGLAKNMGITGIQAAKYGGSIKKMLPMLDQMNQSMDGKKFYRGMMQTQHILQTNIGLTEDQANAYTQYAMQNGDSSDSMLKATKALADTLDPDGTMGYFKMVTEEIAGTGAEIQLQYGRIPANLEMAVLKAKKLGFTLEDLSGTADELLNIESSIGNELEYQLLSGKRLTDSQGNSLTNLYREAALRGDMNKQADTLNEILESQGDVLTDNMFARKQMAQMLGMEENQLASALQKKKILDKAAAAGIEIDLDGGKAADAMGNAARALQEGAITPDEFKNLSKAVDTRTSDDILKEQLDVAKEMKMVQLLQFRQEMLTGKNQDALLEQGKNLGIDLLEWTDTEAAKTGEFLKGKAAAEAALDAAAEIKTGRIEATTGNDLIAYPAGYGNRILLSGEDTFALNNDDTVVAGTNLFPPNNNNTSGNNTPDMTQFAAMIVAAINNQTRALKSDTTFSGGLNAPYYG